MTNKKDFLNEELSEVTTIDQPSFEGQDPNEDVVLVLKKHPVILVKTTIVLAIGLVLVITCFDIFGASLYSSLAAIIYIILGGYYGLRNWHLRNNSTYIVTSNRVISVNQEGLFHRVVSQAPINIIKNVSYETNGPTQTLLKFGTVNILTSGTDKPDVTFADVPHPYEVQQRITLLMMNEPSRDLSTRPLAEIKKNNPNVLR
jgi:hypothetical protein